MAVVPLSTAHAVDRNESAKPHGQWEVRTAKPHTVSRAHTHSRSVLAAVPSGRYEGGSANIQMGGVQHQQPQFNAQGRCVCRGRTTHLHLHLHLHLHAHAARAHELTLCGNCSALFAAGR